MNKNSVQTVNDWVICFNECSIAINQEIYSKNVINGVKPNYLDMSNTKKKMYDYIIQPDTLDTIVYALFNDNNIVCKHVIESKKNKNIINSVYFAVEKISDLLAMIKTLNVSDMDIHMPDNNFTQLIPVKIYVYPLLYENELIKCKDMLLEAYGLYIQNKQDKIMILHLEQQCLMILQKLQQIYTRSIMYIEKYISMYTQSNNKINETISAPETYERDMANDYHLKNIDSFKNHLATPKSDSLWKKLFGRSIPEEKQTQYPVEQDKDNAEEYRSINEDPNYSGLSEEYSNESETK